MTALKRWVRPAPAAEWHQLPGDGLDAMTVCGRRRFRELAEESQIIGEHETPLDGRVCYFCAANCIAPPTPQELSRPAAEDSCIGLRCTRTHATPSPDGDAGEGVGLTAAHVYRIGYAIGQEEAFDAVMALHVRDEDTDSCPQCGRAWPCPTALVTGREVSG